MLGGEIAALDVLQVLGVLGIIAGLVLLITAERF